MPHEELKLGRRISDREIWECESCGVRGLSTEIMITCSGPSGIRTPVCTARVCPRCIRMHPHVLVTAMYFRIKHDRTMPPLEEWLAKSTEPTFDHEEHVLRRRGLLPEQNEPPVEPYKPKKIVVPISASGGV